jgi:hypothetical protein
MTLLVQILAVYRVAHMLARENGPFDSFANARYAIEKKYGVDSWQHAGFNCPLCISFWLSWCVPIVPDPVVWILAIAGGVLAVHRIIDGVAQWRM